MNIAQILKAKGRAVATVRPDAPLSEIIDRLAQKRIGAIVVVGENGEVAGIISERDIIRRLAERGAGCAEGAGRAIHDDVGHHLPGDTSTLDELMEMMTQGRFRHVPVIEDGALVGIVSIGDVVKNHIAEVEMEVTAMRELLRHRLNGAAELQELPLGRCRHWPGGGRVQAISTHAHVVCRAHAGARRSRACMSLELALGGGDAALDQLLGAVEIEQAEIGEPQA